MEKFYLLHGTKSEKSLYEILKSGYLLSGKYVDKKYRMHGGIEDNVLKEIFFNIQFNDIKNIDVTLPFTLIFHPNLLSDYDFKCGKGWGYNTNFIDFNKTDSREEFKTKLKKLRKFIKNPDLPEIYKKFGGILQHELFMAGKVKITKYLVGIICYTSNDKIIKKIEKLTNVLIFTSNIPPKYVDVIKNK